MTMKLKLLSLVAAVAVSGAIMPAAISAPALKPTVSAKSDVHAIQFRRGGFGGGWGRPTIWRPPVAPGPVYKPYGAPGAGRPWVTSKPQMAPQPGYDINRKNQLRDNFNAQAQQQQALRQLFNLFSRGGY